MSRALKPKLKPPIHHWSLIEDENRLTHIVPTVEVQPFDTETQAWDFLNKMEALGNPVVTDEEDNVIATYIGHTLSPACPCGPTQKESDPALYTHHQFQ